MRFRAAAQFDGRAEMPLRAAAFACGRCFCIFRAVFCQQINVRDRRRGACAAGIRHTKSLTEVFFCGTLTQKQRAQRCCPPKKTLRRYTQVRLPPFRPESDCFRGCGRERVLHEAAASCRRCVSHDLRRVFVSYMHHNRAVYVAADGKSHRCCGFRCLYGICIASAAVFRQKRCGVSDRFPRGQCGLRLSGHTP